MIKRLFAILLAMFVATPAFAGDGTGPVHASAGTIVDLGVLRSRYADPRRVVVWLPPGYSRRGQKYSVLYMHDGQNLFDKATAGYGMEWEIDEHLSRLIAEKKVRPTIVVGIWNTPKRLQEYVPSKAFNGLPPEYRAKVRALYGGDPLSDGYLKFIVGELRPMIETGCINECPGTGVPWPDLRWALANLAALARLCECFPRGACRSQPRLKQVCHR